MKRILFIAPSYGNSIVGAGRFVQYLKDYSQLPIHVISESLDKNQYPNDDSINIQLNGIRKKFSVLSQSKYYVKHINRIEKKKMT